MDYLLKAPAIPVSSVNMLLRGEEFVRYDMIADGRTGYLIDHKRFEDDITLAVERLESML